MKIVVLVLLVFIFVRCDSKRNAHFVEKSAPRYKNALSDYLGISSAEIDSNYNFYDSLKVLSIQLVAYKFYNKNCDTAYWNKGYIVIDKTTGNSYVVSDKIIPAECKDPNLRKVYEDKFTESVKRAKRSILNLYISGVDHEIYKYTFNSQTQKVTDYLNNISVDYKDKVSRAVIDSVLRFFYFDKYDISSEAKPLLLQNEEMVDKMMDDLERSNIQYVYLDEKYKRINKKLLDSFRHFLKNNFTDENFFTYAFGRFIFLMTVNVDSNKWSQEKIYTIEMYNPLIFIDSTYTD